MLAAILFCGLAITFATSCKDYTAEDYDLQGIADSIWNYGHSHPEGYVVRTTTMQVPTSGIAVAYLASCGIRSDQQHSQLAHVVAHSVCWGDFMGGWYDQKEDTYYFYSCAVLYSMEEAMQFAKDNSQKYGLDLATGKNVWLGDNK